MLACSVAVVSGYFGRCYWSLIRKTWHLASEKQRSMGLIGVLSINQSNLYGIKSHKQIHPRRWHRVTKRLKHKKLSCRRDTVRASRHSVFRYVTQGHSRSFEMTLLSNACVSCNYVYPLHSTPLPLDRPRRNIVLISIARQHSSSDARC